MIIIFTASYDKYKKCGFDEFSFYCGICNWDDDDRQIMIIWFILHGLGLIFGGVIFYMIYKCEKELSKQKRGSNEIRFYYKLSYVYCLNFIFLGLDILSKIFSIIHTKFECNIIWDIFLSFINV